MNYRTFLESTGRRWECWMVAPAAAERRRIDRRVASGSTDPIPGFADRRRKPDRRKASFKRVVNVSSEYRDGWLCFESDRGERRRLAPVPEGWNEAGPDKLATWLQAAKIVVKCAP